jgi:hypothetical protein
MMSVIYFFAAQVSPEESLAPMITSNDESSYVYKAHNLFWVAYYLSSLSDATLYLFSVEQVARVRRKREDGTIRWHSIERIYRGLPAGISLFTVTSVCRALYGIASVVDASSFVVLSLGLMYLPFSRNRCKLTRREWKARLSVTIFTAVALIVWLLTGESYWYAAKEDDGPREAPDWHTFGLFVAERLAIWTVRVADVSYPRYLGWHQTIRILAMTSAKTDMLLNFLIVTGCYSPPLAKSQPDKIVKPWKMILRSLTFCRVCTLLAGTGLAYAVTMDVSKKEGWVLFENSYGKWIILVLLLVESLVRDLSDEDYDAKDAINLSEWFDELTDQSGPEIPKQATDSEAQST